MRSVSFEISKKKKLSGEHQINKRTKKGDNLKVKMNNESIDLLIDSLDESIK